MTASQLLDEFDRYGRSCGHRPATVFTRHKVIALFIRAVGDPRTVDTSAVVAWLATPTWKPWTRRTYAQSVRRFFGWLYEFGHRPDNPCARLRSPHVPAGVPKPVTDAELRFILNQCRPDGWFRLCVLLCAYGGLRVAEATGLRREHVTESTLTVVDGKGGKTAAIPAHPEIWAAVKDLPSGPVLRGQTGRPLGGKSVSIYARQIFDELGLPDVHLHRLRHWFGTTVQRNQGDLRVTQELMRHTSVSSTQVYTQVATAAKVAAVSGLAA
jgi:integrase